MLESLANFVDHVYNKFAITWPECRKLFAQPDRLIVGKCAGWQNEFVDPATVGIGKLKKTLKRRHHHASLESGHGLLTNPKSLRDFLLGQLRSNPAPCQSCAQSSCIQFRNGRFQV